MVSSSGVLYLCHIRDICRFDPDHPYVFVYLESEDRLHPTERTS